MQREAEAKRVSDRIDEQLNIDRERYKKSKQDVRVRYSSSPGRVEHRPLRCPSVKSACYMLYSLLDYTSFSF